MQLLEYDGESGKSYLDSSAILQDLLQWFIVISFVSSL